MNRAEMLSRLTGSKEPWEMVVIGGGATGLGVAVDAAARGYRVVLLEQSDFGKGTSSRSTKLVHGGVRYLRQGNLPLVMESLRERGMLRHNAPHLVTELRFIVPVYDWWEAPFYGLGMKLYDLLAGRHGFGPSRLLNREQTIAFLPTIKTAGLRGGVQYFDGLFDDARLLISLARTAAAQGATLVNYLKVTRLLKKADGRVSGLVARDMESQVEFEIRAQVVINATGPFTDSLLRLDDPKTPPMISPSQGTHLVLDKAFLPTDSAIMVPKTRDGRIVFAIPWHHHALIGTTDTPVDEVCLEPAPSSAEVDFLLETVANYLKKPPTRQDVISMFAGIRPLVRGRVDGATAKLSRDHSIRVSGSGLVTVCGGKWTTYRKMASDAVDQAVTIARLEPHPCRTQELPIHGHEPNSARCGPLAVYGSDAPAIQGLMDADPPLREPLHPALPYTQAEVVWASRLEMARTVDDVLSRRTRALVLNARAARSAALRVAALLARELGHDAAWQTDQLRQFEQITDRYILPA